MVKLLVVLQTHSVSNNQSHITRYMSDDKSEISYRCVRSLVNSLNWCLNKTGMIDITLQVFDDHSDEKFLKRLDNILKEAKFKHNVTHLETKGIMPSILKCYQHGHEHAEDLVYFVQDDYLYYESAIWEMVDAYFTFSEKTKQPVCIYPFDDTYHYYKEKLPLVTLHLGAKRHWRTGFAVASPFMVDKDTLTKNFDLFEKMGNEPVSTIMEDVSINRLFSERNCILFTPIPSLALHSQSDIEKDPYIDWRPLWDKFEESKETTYDHLFNTEKKILLNIGAGKTKLEHLTDYFTHKDYKEIRVDIGDCNQHISSSITTLAGVPDNSVDLVYASHVVEHVYWHELPNVFSSIMRVLKSDGSAIIRVPDIGSIAHMIPNELLGTVYDSSVGPVTPIDMIYGHRGLVHVEGDGMSHKIGFTEKSMMAVLKELNIDSMIKTSMHEVQVILCKTKPPSYLDDPKFVI